jgi:hypothetical protein
VAIPALDCCDLTLKVSQFSPPLWPWCAEPAAGLAAQWLPQDPLVPGARRYLGAPSHCLVERYGDDCRARTLTCAEQYRAMALLSLPFGRVYATSKPVCRRRPRSDTTWAFGIQFGARRSPIGNETRDWRIYAEFAQRLIAQARRLYAGDSLGVDLDNTVCLLRPSICACRCFLGRTSAAPRL